MERPRDVGRENEESSLAPETRETAASPGGSPRSEVASEDVFPDELLKGMSLGRGVLFIGPGIPKAAGLTMREDLDQAIRVALRRSVPVSEAGDLEQFLEVAGPAEAAQALRDQLGKEGFVKFLGAHLQPRDVPPPSILFALRALPFKVIMTTNFDHAIERVLEHPLEDQVDADVVVPRPGNGDIPDPEDRPVLVKLFGDYTEPETLVVTSDDYATYFRKRPQLVARLRDLLELGPPLFVGFGLRDPEFLRLYSQVGALVARSNRSAFAILPYASRFDRRWWARRSLVLLTPSVHHGEESVVRRLHQRFQALVYPEMAFVPDPTLMTSPLRPVSPWNLAPLLVRQLEACARDLLGPGEAEVLETGYIPQSLNVEGLPGDDRESRLEALMAEGNPSALEQLKRPVAIDPIVALQKHAHVLVHAPAGAGKTTLLLHLLQARTRAATDSGERALTVYLSCREIAENPERQLIDLIVERLAGYVSPDTELDVENGVMDALLEGRALLLLDGLEEVSQERESVVWDRLRALLQDCPKVRFVITCRSSSLVPENLPDEPELVVFELCPLTPDQQHAFIRNRLRNRPFAPQLLTSFLRTGVAPWARRLASNPLHLSLLCLQFLEDNTLPESRAALYEAFMSIVLRRTQPGKENVLYAYDKELVLQSLAFHAMTHPGEPLDADLVLELAAREMDRANVAPRRDVSVANLPSEAIDEIVQGSGILVRSQDGKTYDFRMVAHKEYLVARRLASLEEAERREHVVAHATDRRWAGVWRLVAALIPDATSLLEVLDERLEQGRRRVVRVFGDAARVDLGWIKAKVVADSASPELGELLGRLRRQLTDSEKLDLCAEILWQDQEKFLKEGRRSDSRALYVALSTLHQMSALERETAHRATEAIANWRGSVDLEEGPDVAMQLVPGGSFLMGTVESGESRYVDVPAFEIAKTPVTVERYKVFDPSYDVGKRERRRAFAKADHPAVQVSWYDAWVCADWFGCRLPDEFEWEKAATWDAEQEVKRTYPWGDGWDSARCNSREMWRSAGHTTAVGRFGARGQSPYGCWDMAGNVLEWTASRGEGTLERRVLKGGNWYASSAAVQPARAVWLRPGFRNSGIGFRLCRTCTDET